MNSVHLRHYQSQQSWLAASTIFISMSNIFNKLMALTDAAAVVLVDVPDALVETPELLVEVPAPLVDV
jgi:hypothetical protein